MFITFEGCDGSGKTTQAKILADYLISCDVNVLLTSEPLGNSLGKIVADFLNGNEVAPLSQTLLYSAIRREHMLNVIVPALKKKYIVICDRFMDSTAAYQGYGMGIPLQFIHDLNDIVTNDLHPELTVFLDMDPEASLSRIAKKDKYEKSGKEFYNKVYDGFKKIAKLNRKRIVSIDANKPKNEIMDEVIASIGRAVSAR